MGGKNKKSKGNKTKTHNHNNDLSTAEDTIEQELTAKDVNESNSISENSELTPSKRRIEEDDDSEPEMKRKKKKKKQAVPEENTGKKNKKSIRQMKREKHAERQAEAEAAAKDQLKSQCISYLSQWKHDRQNWKFMKAKQVWLYKNKFSQLVPDSSWPIFLEYFESAKGNIRNMLLSDANKIIKQMDDWTESQEKEEQPDEEAENEKSSVKPDDVVYSRARSLIQCLEE